MTPPLPPGPFGTIVADPAWKFRDRGVRGAAEKHYKTMTVEQIARIPVEEIAAENAHLFLWAPDAFILDGSASLVARMWGFKKPTQFVCWRKTRGGDLDAAVVAALAALTKNTITQGKDQFIALDDDLRAVLQALADTRKKAALAMGQGYYARHCFELALLCVRGKATAPEGAKNILAMFDAERTDEHSEKPDEIFKMAERLSPGGARLEMFARAAREGWTVWGDQAPQATVSPEQLVERLNEKVRKIMEDGGQQIARIVQTDGSIDGALEKARADFTAVRDARRGGIPAKSSPPRYDEVYAAGTAALNADAAGHAVGCYVNGMAEDGHTEVWACADGCPIGHAERKMIAEHEEAVGPDPANLDAAVPITRNDDLDSEVAMTQSMTVVSIRGAARSLEVGKDYALPDGRVGEYVGNENFYVKPANPKIKGAIFRALPDQVIPTDLISAVACQTCGWLIAAEAAENAEACPYCTRKET